MSRTAKPKANRVNGMAWGALSLLVISVCINYIDRGNLSVAAPLLTEELRLDPVQLGLLLSSFFWTYASFQIVSGWLVDRFEVKWVYGLGFFIWSVATLATGLVGSFGALFALRLVLGAGESVAYPAFSKIIAAHFPEHRRGLTNALIDAGSKLGPALGTLLGGLIVARFGWRALFIVLGGGSMIWIPFWIIWGPRVGPAPAAESAPVAGKNQYDGPGYLAILRQRSAWGTFIGLFAVNYVWYFLITWLPTYLVTERGFTLSQMAIFGSLPFWGLALSSTAAGWTSDHLIAKGGTPTRVRKAFTSSGLLATTLVLPAVMVPSRSLSMVLLTVACLSLGLTTSNLWAMSQTIAGPKAAGKWTGAQNGFGNLAGVVAPYLTGVIVSQTHSFFLAFFAAFCVLLAGAAGYLFVVGPVVPIEWPQKNRVTQPESAA